MMCSSTAMLAVFSICCCIARVTFGAPQSGLTSISVEEVIAYADDYYHTIGPTPDQRAKNEGYSAETHELETEDGYILHIHRITGSEKSPKSDNKTPVLLLHGLLQCSVAWVIGTPKKSLGRKRFFCTHIMPVSQGDPQVIGFIKIWILSGRKDPSRTSISQNGYLLADNGYDVWLGNTRGNRYARNHTRLTTKDKEYWLFSWHEIGVYDIPAMMDYILGVTNKQKVLYVGHSQGATSFFAMASTRPEYQDKVEAMFALGPSAYVNHSTLPSIRFLAPIANNLRLITDLIGLYEIMPSNKFIQRIARKACKDDSVVQPLCISALVLFVSPGERLLNKTLFSEAIQYDPAGASIRQFIHYAQLINSGRFSQYDHGLMGNMRRYNSPFPPDYPLEKIKIPVYLYYGSNDGFVNVIDVNRLYKRLPNSQKYLVPDPSFTHIDFIWSKPMNVLIHNKVLEHMENHR